jgi:outer membrane lipoprotein-sorting protein
MWIRLPARTLLPVFLFGALVSSSWAEEDSPQLDRLFDEIRAARMQVRYEAEQTVYAFTREKTVVSRFHVQYAYPYLKRESLGESPETRFVFFEDGTYLWRYLPFRKIAVKEPSHGGADGFFPSDLLENLSLIRENYHFVIRGPVPADAGECRIIEFVPKWQDRPRREIWLEEKWKIPVRVCVVLPDGRTSYMAELRRIAWNPDFKPEAFELKVPEDTRVVEIREDANLTMEQAQSMMNRPLQLPRFVPPGFIPFNILFRVEGARKRLQIVYADGLSSFSIFQEWTGGEPKKDAERSGAPPAESEPVPRFRQYGLINVLTIDLPGRKTVFVGDVQEEKLLETARSLPETSPPP